MRNLIIAFILILICNACIPEDPFLTDEEVTELKKPDKFELAVIKNQDVFLISGHAGTTPRQLTFDGTDKSEVKISWDPQKIAYLDKDSKPFVINLADSSIKAILDKEIVQMDWIDSNTLYLFDGNEISYYGKAIQPLSLTIPDEVPANTTQYIKSACINSVGELAYIVEYYNSSIREQILVLKDSENEHLITPHIQNLNKVIFDSEGKLEILINTTSATQTYYFDDVAIFESFDAAFKSSTISREYDFEDYVGYISLYNRRIFISGKKDEFDNSFTLFIMDWGKGAYNIFLEGISESKLYFDFK